MEKSRRLIFFPVAQFYAVVGTITMPEDPYGMSITDILNEKSSTTHGARDHIHRHGRVYLTASEFYSLDDNRQRICRSLETIHLALNEVRAVIDCEPERFRGSEWKRQEYSERLKIEGSVRFALLGHVLSGSADERDIYRQSEQFLGLSRLRLEEVSESPSLSLPDFLASISCPFPDYMAVNMGRIVHT